MPAAPPALTRATHRVSNPCVPWCSNNILSISRSQRHPLRSLPRSPADEKDEIAEAYDGDDKEKKRKLEASANAWFLQVKNLQMSS